MTCTKPTIIKTYHIIGYDKQIVKYIHNLDYTHLIELQNEIGAMEIIQITQRDENNTKGLYKKGQHVKAQLTGIYTINCGKCEECIKQNLNNKANRIYLDYIECKRENKKGGYFITLTYNEENLPKNNNLSMIQLQCFIEYLKKLDPELRYYAAGEYGSHTLRPHYHLVIWNTNINWGKQTLVKVGKQWNTYKIENPCWKRGEMTISKLTPQSIKYTVGYSSKKLKRTKEEKDEIKKHHIQPEFNLQSRGIAYNYYKHHLQEILDNKGLIYENGQTIEVDRSFIKYLDKYTVYPRPEWSLPKNKIIKINTSYKDLQIMENILKQEDHRI